MVERKHHGPAGSWIENACETVLHPPVKRAAALDVEGAVLLGNADAEVLAFLDIVLVSHNSSYHIMRLK